MATLQLGFDPLDPEVLRSIKGEKKKPKELTGLGGFEEFELGYSEVTIEPLPAEEEAPPQTGSEETKKPAAAQEDKAGPQVTTEGSPATVILIALGAMFAVVLLTGFAILRKSPQS